jgi:hypothetical protein
MIIQKFDHSHLPCNVRNNIMYEFKPPYCRLCPNTQEDQIHVLRCKECTERGKIRDNFKKEFYVYLINSNTNSTNARVLSYTINAWLNNAPIPKLSEIAPDASPTLIKAFNFQHKIGWKIFFKGR